MGTKIFELLNELKEDLSKKERMEYSELKEKVEVIETEYTDITDDITLKMVDLKKAKQLICEIENEATIIYRTPYTIKYLAEALNNVIRFGDGGSVENDFEDTIPFPDYLKEMSQELVNYINSQIKNEGI